MKYKSKRTWIPLTMVILLLLLAGCQPVNGLDVNKVFQNSLNVKSSQGAQTITMEYVLNEAVTPNAEDQKMLELFSKLKLTLTEIKQQSPMQFSAKGIFEYNKGQIPFTVSADESQTVFSIDGASKPIVLQADMVTAIQQVKDEASEQIIGQQLKEYRNKLMEFRPTLFSYLIGIAPNPNTISVTDSKFNVHNEEINGKQIHIELKGSELLELIKGLLTNALADEAGLKELLGQIYDLYVPMLQLTKPNGVENEESGESNPFTDTISPFLENKELAVELFFSFIKSYLSQMLDNYDPSIQELESSSEESKSLFSDSQSLKMDLFIDSEQMTRKANTEIIISPPAKEEESPVLSFKLTSSSEAWDINKALTADVIDTSNGKLELESLGNPARVITVADPKSQLYTLLKNDLSLTKKEINVLIDSPDEFGMSSGKPYNRQGTVMVPVRLVKDQLDADIEWDEFEQKVTIKDPFSSTVIRLNVGSKLAFVNGSIVPLETEPELHNSSPYVPIRFIAENLGAKVTWNQELQMVTINRD